MKYKKVKDELRKQAEYYRDLYKKGEITQIEAI